MRYYYGRGYRRSWKPPKYSALTGLFGNAVGEIKSAFLNMDSGALDELFAEYGGKYGKSAEAYARKTHPKWRIGTTTLSGQTMERLIELVPPYLSSDQRFAILKTVLKYNKKNADARTIRINVKEPQAGFAELDQVLASMTHDDLLAHLPERVMKAASWLYADDVTSARAMLAEAERVENEIIRASAKREIELLRRTIATGQVKAANYSVTMPAGRLNVVAYEPSFCIVATVCFGQNAPETMALRKWRDGFLVSCEWGREFIVWYYRHGQRLAMLLERFPALKAVAKSGIRLFVRAMDYFGVHGK
ncbi:CFI-box-CTERM domain-containing protein [Methylocystis sp. JAN1]|uniref:CFI-box-CTERM domain-containing protein n=1 Tax=Methylocystis sp. JAN1 TaxID=3397211 RepID=UPI003FA22180